MPKHFLFRNRHLIQYQVEFLSENLNQEKPAAATFLYIINTMNIAQHKELCTARGVIFQFHFQLLRSDIRDKIFYCSFQQQNPFPHQNAFNQIPLNLLSPGHSFSKYISRHMSRILKTHLVICKSNIVNYSSRFYTFFL